MMSPVVPVTILFAVTISQEGRQSKKTLYRKTAVFPQNYCSLECLIFC